MVYSKSVSTTFPWNAHMCTEKVIRSVRVSLFQRHLCTEYLPAVFKLIQSRCKAFFEVGL